jgi:hypothetical protein
MLLGTILCGLLYDFGFITIHFGKNTNEGAKADGCPLSPLIICVQGLLQHGKLHVVRGQRQLENRGGLITWNQSSHYEEALPVELGFEF